MIDHLFCIQSWASLERCRLFHELCLSDLFGKGLIVEALTAEWLIHVLTADYLQVLALRGTESEARVLVTVATNRL